LQVTRVYVDSSMSLDHSAKTALLRIDNMIIIFALHFLVAQDG